SSSDELPLFAVPCFDAEFLDLLAVVETLHEQRVIEGNRLGEIHFEHGVMRAGRRRPEGVGVAVESGLFIFVWGRGGLGAGIWQPDYSSSAPGWQRQIPRVASHPLEARGRDRRARGQERAGRRDQPFHRRWRSASPAI